MAYLMQRILIGSLLLSSLTVVPSALAADKTATVSVSPGSGSKTVNTNFTVDFKLNTGGQAVGGVNVKVNYSGLELVSTDATGSVFSNEVTPPGTGNPFSIVRVRFDTGFNGSDGLLLKATFKPTAAGSPTITINQGESEVTAYSDSTNILKSVANGSYTVGGSSTSGSSGSSPSNTITAISPAAGTVPVKEKSTLEVKKACAKPDGSDVVLVNVTPKDKDGKVLTGNTYRPSFTGAGLTVVVKATKTAGVWEGVLTSKKEAKVPVIVKSSGVELGKVDAEFKASGCTVVTTTTTPSPSSSLEPSPSISPITKISPRLSPIPTSSNKIKPAHLTLFAIGLILLIGGLIALWKMGHTKDTTHPPKPPAPPSAGPPNPPSPPSSPPPPPPIVAPPQ